MRKILFTIIFSFNLAVSSLDNIPFRQPVPVIYEMQNTPVYGRKRDLKKHYKASYYPK